MTIETCPKNEIAEPSDKKEPSDLQGDLRVGEITIHAYGYAGKPWIYKNMSEGTALTDKQVDKLKKLLKKFFTEVM